MSPSLLVCLSDYQSETGSLEPTLAPESTERGPWLAGTDFSLADIAAIPYMVRLEMLRLSPMWDKKPGVAKWWERVKTRPSYEPAITKWLRPENIARYENVGDPWIDMSKNLAQ